MFQPQPTPFAAAAFASYGVGQVQELSGPDYLFASTPLALQNGGPPLPLPLPLVYAAHPPASSPAVAAHFSSFNSHAQPELVKMDPSLDDDVAAQQAAAREYQPQLEGPLVGEKTLSHVITEEYAKADQVYVAKTIALPQTYSHYRPIQGDGNCGWRAIGFSYFETLIHEFDKQQIEGEIRRIGDLNQYILTAGGYDMSLFEDMVEETITLLRDIADSMANPDVAMAVLTERFNDRSCSNHIIYHLRLLASSWLKENPGPYEPFIPDDMGIAGYCQECIERPDREIEHLGIVLLTNVLLKPLGFVLEIAYLDRSPGDQVNSYRFPEEANEQQLTELGPVINLLFRPDHYDILYKPKPVRIQVHKVTSCKHDTSVLSNGPRLSEFTVADYSPLALMPNLAHVGFAPPGTSSPLSDSFMPASTGAWLSASYPEPVQQPAPVLPPPPTTLPPPQPTSTTPVTTYPLRFSREMHRLPAENFIDPPTFTTNMFKNSHFNKAHYNNPDFHPEEWIPDDDTPERGGGGRKKGRGKHE